MEENELKIQESVDGKQKSKLKRYMELVLGSNKLLHLIKYEMIILLSSWVPGALGIVLRGKLYPTLFKKVGRGVVFGTNLVIRHPKKISIGDNVIIDDNVLLDAKGLSNIGIRLNNDVFIGRNTILSCKGGNISLDDRANIGFNCEIFSSNNVSIGKDVLVAAYTYIVGGGNYHLDRKDIPINKQFDFNGKGGIEIKDDNWIGSHCVILDGVSIENGCAIAAGAIVNKNVPEYSIVAGVPAKVIKTRT